MKSNRLVQKPASSSIFGRALALIVLLGSFGLAVSPVPGRVKYGIKELMDHWKADKVVSEEAIIEREVPVVEEKVIDKIICRDIEADPPALEPPLLPPAFVSNKTVEV